MTHMGEINVSWKSPKGQEPNKNKNQDFEPFRKKRKQEQSSLKSEKQYSYKKNMC